MGLRKGKTKTILESSMDSALLAVEVYNKPRTTFRAEAYITLMIMAWTRLFHAHFNNTIGDRFYYKDPNGRFKMVDGQRKAWEITECIKKYGSLSEPVKKNLEFFIKLRNRIEHRNIDRKDVDVLIFGECQALLYNYESLLIDFFGDEYSLIESLVYSLQFSQIRQKGQVQANKSALSKDIADIFSYVEKYRNSISEVVYNSQEFSIKLIQVPKISNTSRAEAAIEFVRWSELDDDDKAKYDQLAVIVKDKSVKIEATNVGRLKPSKVVDEVNKSLVGQSISRNDHSALWRLFSVRPESDADDPFDTNVIFCHYDEAHNDYLYQEAWVEFIVRLVQSNRLTNQEIRDKARFGEKLNIEDFHGV